MTICRPATPPLPSPSLNTRPTEFASSLTRGRRRPAPAQRSRDIASNKQIRARPSSFSNNVAQRSSCSNQPAWHAEAWGAAGPFGARDCVNVSAQWPHQPENLGLIIAHHGVKPAVVMKTLSRRFWFVVFGVIVIVAVGSCCCIPCIPGIAYSVEIGNTRSDQYAKWKQPDLDR